MLTELTLAVSEAIPSERRDWNFQTVACAAGGMPPDPLTITLTLVQETGEVCFTGLLAMHLRPWPLTHAFPTLQHSIFEGDKDGRLADQNIVRESNGFSEWLLGKNDLDNCVTGHDIWSQPSHIRRVFPITVFPSSQGGASERSSLSRARR